MPEIGLTDFVDFALKTGPSQLTKVCELKLRPDYDPAIDYWKKLRDALVAYVYGDLDQNQLQDRLRMVTSAKQANYAAALAGFRKFDGRRVFGDPCQPPTGRWVESALVVRVTPELSFRRDRQRISVKLYFKNDPRPTKDRLGSILVLMQETLPQDRVAVLDVRSGRLYDEQPSRRDINVFLRAQAQAFLHMWNAIG